MSGNRARGMVIKDGKILLIRRVKDGEEYYLFPGGGQESGETLEETVVREVNEETSIEIVPEKLVYHVTWGPEGDHFFYLCRYVAGEPCLRADSEELAKMKEGKELYEPLWAEFYALEDLVVYPLEIRDLLIKDMKSGFSDKTQDIHIKFSERRQA